MDHQHRASPTPLFCLLALLVPMFAAILGGWRLAGTDNTWSSSAETMAGLYLGYALGFVIWLQLRVDLDRLPCANLAVASLLIGMVTSVFLGASFGPLAVAQLVLGAGGLVASLR